MNDNINNTQVVNEGKNVNKLTADGFAKIYRGYQNFVSIKILKAVLLSILVIALWASSFFVMVLFTDITPEDGGIIFIVVSIISVVLLLLVNIFAFKRVKKKAKEMKAIYNANPEVTREFHQRNKKSLLIRLAIFGVLAFLILLFSASKSRSERYDGYSADYEYNEEYREAVDEIADEYGEDSQSVDRIFQYFGKYS